MSAPKVSPDCPSAGWPPVKIAPTYDCWSRFRLTRATKKFFSLTIGRSPGRSRRSPVRTPSTPTSVRPTVPVSLTPASIGTSRPPSRPICRLKNGYTSAPVGGMPPAGSGPMLAKLKTPAPCRKKDRFSGKSTEKRERLIWRASTSVSPKSVLKVAVSFRLGVML